VDVDGSCQFSADSLPRSVGLRVGGHPELSMHSSNEPGKLSLAMIFGHDDSTVNIVVVIIIVF